MDRICDEISAAMANDKVKESALRNKIFKDIAAAAERGENWCIWELKDCDDSLYSKIKSELISLGYNVISNKTQSSRELEVFWKNIDEVVEDVKLKESLNNTCKTNGYNHLLKQTIIQLKEAASEGKSRIVLDIKCVSSENVSKLMKRLKDEGLTAETDYYAENMVIAF